MVGWAVVVALVGRWSRWRNIGDWRIRSVWVCRHQLAFCGREL